MSSPSSDEIFNNWSGIIDDDFSKTVLDTFGLSQDDKYVYRAESFAMTLPQIQETLSTGKLKYHYQDQGKVLQIPLADIDAYTSIFSSKTDTSKALIAFSSNAKKGSPREWVANYLQSRRIPPSCKIPKAKAHINPYYDIWAHTCRMVSFLGPLPDAHYADPAAAKMTHPVLPVLYHHFGCVVPSYDSLYTISQLVEESKLDGIIDMASGNGYWTYMLRRMKVKVNAVDNMASEYRNMWISDTEKADGVEYLRKNGGGKNKLLLMVYMITAGTFTKRVLSTYKGDVIVVVGTQNANRYTGLSDCSMEEWFEKEMNGWELICRISMPSFAGKDEGMFVWKRKN
ncbi:97a6e09d-d3de-45a2-ba66-e872ca91eb77 [Sclerotinia trifoliorum]|uniref:97a6e09d-d3de-45a2-ba66-e872ca91eb77 n=1 Tax=Sclerotinia trifoliorum TaxID=28548 RepID=A0A8H2VVZ8_9HELO|nr:97a6e09d-d3de-45a2-ba66-e872ca91eb77 [Sclerotinia trifoliorum]